MAFRGGAAAFVTAWPDDPQHGLGEDLRIDELDAVETARVSTLVSKQGSRLLASPHRVRGPVQLVDEAHERRDRGRMTLSRAPACGCRSRCRRAGGGERGGMRRRAPASTVCCTMNTGSCALAGVVDGTRDPCGAGMRTTRRIELQRVATRSRSTVPERAARQRMPGHRRSVKKLRGLTETEVTPSSGRRQRRTNRKPQNHRPAIDVCAALHSRRPTEAAHEAAGHDHELQPQRRTRVTRRSAPRIGRQRQARSIACGKPWTPSAPWLSAIQRERQAAHPTEHAPDHDGAGADVHCGWANAPTASSAVPRARRRQPDATSEHAELREVRDRGQITGTASGLRRRHKRRHQNSPGDRGCGETSRT